MVQLAPIVAAAAAVGALGVGTAFDASASVVGLSAATFAGPAFVFSPFAWHPHIMLTDYCQCGHERSGHDNSDQGGTCLSCACTGYRNVGPVAPAKPDTGGPVPPVAVQPVAPAPALAVAEPPAASA